MGKQEDKRRKVLLLFLFLVVATRQAARLASLLVDAEDDSYAASFIPGLLSTTATARTIQNHSLLLRDYASGVILEKGCSITVVLYSPHVSSGCIWALESAAANIRPIETTCFLIQTSSCKMEEERNLSKTEAFAAVAESITNDAQPKFRAAIAAGQVRMSIVDNIKYHLIKKGESRCDDFGNPSKVWLNFNYWGPDEFSPLDSDLILIVQADVVLCHPLHADRWRKYAWVGSPWPPKSASRGDGGFPLMCDVMPKMWEQWHTKKNTTFPTVDDICTNVSLGPVGNGGFSLRSRKWLRRAIMYCPLHGLPFSGLPKKVGNPNHARSKVCNVNALAMMEDIIFAVLLRGLGAPLPSAYEASLFGGETRYPEAYEKHYNLTDLKELETMVDQLWSESDVNGTRESGVDRYRRMRAAGEENPGVKHPVIPIGLHKPGRWLAPRPKDKKRQLPYTLRECPHLQHSLWPG